MCSKNLKIDTEKCIHCGQCLKDCITSCLEFDENNFPKFVDGGEARCIKCQHCFAICPTGALSICDKNSENSDSINENRNSDELLNLIKSRRSFRHYKDKNLDIEKMNKLKDMLKWVPTGVNNHRLHFSFVDDKDVMEELRNNVNTKLVELIKKTPLKSVKKKFARYADSILAGNDVIFRKAPHMVVVSSPLNAPCTNVDPIIALSYFELYAQSLGVATLWCGLAYACFMLFPEVCEQLEIPEGYKLSYVMLFGESDSKYARTTQPDDCKIISVKKSSGEKIGLLRKAKRFLWNAAK